MHKNIFLVCNNPKSIDNISIDKSDKDYPFLCMDLTFIYTLLSQGFGLPNDKQINVIDCYFLFIKLIYRKRLLNFTVILAANQLILHPPLFLILKRFTNSNNFLLIVILLLVFTKLTKHIKIF